MITVPSLIVRFTATDFNHDGVPFIIAYIVMDESAADDAKRAEMKDYVDEMVNTVRAAQ